MDKKLLLNENDYTTERCRVGNTEITYRAFRNIVYCTAPVASVQKMNIFVPEIYYHGGEINGYDVRTAPVFMPNTVGGYMEGPADEPGEGRFGNGNSSFHALAHGYVVAAAGVRGRTTGRRNTEFYEGSTEKECESDRDRPVGKAPAFIVDMKAAIRYLRANKDMIPGNMNCIITNGTSAGGALSALAGATGNSTDYELYLEEIGAAKERDDIFAASCYCPIHNLEHADAAYEWLFNGCNDFYRTKHAKTKNGIERVPYSGSMTDEQIRMSDELKQLFPEYVNSLNLTDLEGHRLYLNENGTGSFSDYVMEYVMKSAQKELDTRNTEKNLSWLSVDGSAIDEQEYLTVKDGKVTEIDIEGFVSKIMRMKSAPAFDAPDLSSPENEEFGTEEIKAKHFTKYSYANSKVGGGMADEDVIRMMNPIYYIGKADTAPHWRIRHGAFDRDTSLAIPVILAEILRIGGYDVDFFLPWGLPHSGDYDLDELFAWIDNICTEQ